MLYNRDTMDVRKSKEGEMGKTPEYVMRSIDRYRQGKKNKSLIYSVEEIDRMEAVGLTTSEIRRLVKEELERREAALK